MKTECCIVVFYLLHLVSGRPEVPEEDILYEIFYSYNKHARPSPGPNYTVPVAHSLTITRIVSMEKNILSADTWQSVKWIDNRLTWKPFDYSHVRYINIPDEMLWIPDILLYNNAAATSGKTYASVRVVVSNTGHAGWIPPTRVTAYCEDIIKSDRPNVKVGDLKCPLKFGSWTYHEKSLNLTIDGEGLLLGDFIEGPDYEIVDHDVKRENLNYACCPEPYPALTYTIWLRKKCPKIVVPDMSCTSGMQGDEADAGDTAADGAQDDDAGGDGKDEGSETSDDEPDAEADAEDNAEKEAVDADTDATSNVDDSDNTNDGVIVDDNSDLNDNTDESATDESDNDRDGGEEGDDNPSTDDSQTSTEEASQDDKTSQTEEGVKPVVTT